MSQKARALWGKSTRRVVACLLAAVVFLVPAAAIADGQGIKATWAPNKVRINGVAKEWTKDGQPAEIKRRTGVIGLGISALEHLARTVVHYPSYIWLAAAVNRIDIYFWVYGAVNVLYLGQVFLLVSWRLCRFERPASAPEGEE